MKVELKNEITKVKDEITTVKGASISQTLLDLFKQQYASPNQGPTLQTYHFEQSSN